MLRKILTVGLLIIATGSKAGIYDDCAAAISKGDNATVERLAKLIRRFTAIPTDDVKEAEACVSAAEGSPHRYFFSAKKFISIAEYEAAEKRAKLEAAQREKERKERERQRQKQAIEDERRRKELAEIKRQKAIEEERLRKELAELERQKAIAEEAIRSENAALIGRDVYSVCNELFRKNKVQAMTNEICLTSFRINGHPELGKPMP